MVTGGRIVALNFTFCSIAIAEIQEFFHTTVILLGLSDSEKRSTKSVYKLHCVVLDLQ